ncbi:unnamed protein product, partial [Closterium sp. NIES-64]
APPPFLYGPAALHFAAPPPSAERPAALLLCRATRAAAHCTTLQRAPKQPPAAPPSTGGAEPPSRGAAEPPNSRATSSEPPSRRAASRRAAEQPSLRAAPQPSRSTAESPDLPCLGRAIDFEVWVDDLQLFLQCDRADGLSLFDLTSGAVPAPAADADATVHSHWATRDAAARLAVRRHLPTAERAHFSQYKSAQTFDTRYRAALPADFCAKNPPPMYITLYFLVTRLPDSLRVVRDHFLAVCPTTLTVDSLEKALLAAEKSIVAVRASRGDPRAPIFEGCSASPLLPSVASASAADLVGLESRSVRRLPLAGDVALARARGAREQVGPVGAVEVEVEAAEGVGVAVEVVAGVGC